MSEHISQVCWGNPENEYQVSNRCCTRRGNAAYLLWQPTRTGNDEDRYIGGYEGAEDGAKRYWEDLRRAHDLFVASGIIYVAVGSDGAKFTDTPRRNAVVAGAHPGVGIEVPVGTVTLKIKGSEKDLVAKSAAAKAKSAAEASAVASLSSRTDACDRPSSCGGMCLGHTSSSDWPEN
jgi:hypothetical protein